MAEDTGTFEYGSIPYAGAYVGNMEYGSVPALGLLSGEKVQNAWVKVSGTWTKVVKIWAKVSGVWTETSLNVKVGSNWKLIHEK